MIGGLVGEEDLDPKGGTYSSYDSPQLTWNPAGCAMCWVWVCRVFRSLWGGEYMFSIVCQYISVFVISPECVCVWPVLNGCVLYSDWV